jgi:hypothetical protein
LEKSNFSVDSYRKCGLKRVEPPAKKEKVYVIDSEKYREGIYEKLDN